MLDLEAEPGERRGGKIGRRVEDHHQPPGALRRDQRRREQADLADAGMGQQQLAQHPARPAAVGQLGIERGEAARHRTDGAAAELVAEPACRMQGFRRQARRGRRRAGGWRAGGRRADGRRAEHPVPGGKRRPAERRGNGSGHGVHLTTVRI